MTPPTTAAAGNTSLGAPCVSSSPVLAGALVEGYYQLIDRQDVAAVVELFAEDAIYERAEDSYRGRAAIRRFFEEERRIRGVHALETVLSLGQRVVALGLFIGQGAAGDPRSMAFVDIWDFSTVGLVSRRRTFLASGAERVRA